jgi:hypothetical protein
VIRQLAIAGDVLQARGGVRKHRRHQVVGQHPLQLRRHAAAATRARHRQRDRGVPPPARLEHRRVEERLHQHVARRLRMQVAEDVGQRERVLRPERQQDGVFGGGRLQLEVELAAELLAQRQAPRLVDAAAERRVQHQLHPTRLVEEALEHERLLRRNGVEGAAAVVEIREHLLRRLRGHAGVVGQPATSSELAPPRLSRRSPTICRRSLTARDSSLLRAGASPSQNGIDGGAPFASATRTTPVVTCRICHDALPS